MSNKIFYFDSNGRLKIELWTVLPIMFLFSLMLSARPDYNFIQLLPINLICTSLVGLSYLGEYSYKKLKK